MRRAHPLLSLVALATMVVVRSGMARADAPRRPVLLFDASPAQTAAQGARLTEVLGDTLEHSRFVRLVRREGSGVYVAVDGRVDPAAPSRAREALLLARDAMARLALDEAERAFYDALSLHGVPASPEDFEQFLGAQLELASVLLEAQKQNSALQLFARAVVLSPDHELDPERFSPFVREAFADARRTAALLPRGDLRVASDPPGAEVIVDGRVRGVTPVQIDDLFSGEHVLALRAPGRAPFARVIPVGAGTSHLTALLAPASGTEAPELLAARLARALDADVALLIEAREAGGRLRLAGANNGDVGAYRELPADAARIEPFLDELFRPPPAPVDFRVRIRPARIAWYERWYVWAIGAAVVGGAIATTLAITGGGDDTPTAGFLDNANQ